MAKFVQVTKLKGVFVDKAIKIAFQNVLDAWPF